MEKMPPCLQGSKPTGGFPLIIELKHVQKTYQSPEGEVCALEDVSFGLEDGRFLSIVGPSGCGKSTLLSIIAGLEPASSGSIVVDGVPVSGVTPAIGYMPQKDQLFAWRSIWDNVTLGLELQHKKTQENLARTRQLLQRYGLEAFADCAPRQLSGGMRQRCALIRTLATDPRILLLDEPFSALDYQTRLSVSDDIHTIIRREGKTAILVTHDISESISMSDRVLVLSARPGRVRSVHEGPFEGLTPMQRRDHPLFHKFFNDIWKELELSV